MTKRELRPDELLNPELDLDNIQITFGSGADAVVVSGADRIPATFVHVSPLRTELEACPDNAARALGYKYLARLEAGELDSEAGTHQVLCLARLSLKVGA